MLQQLIQRLGWNIDMASMMPLYLLAGARAAALLSFSSLFGANVMPLQARVGFAFLLAATMFPGISLPASGMELTTGLWIALVAKEVMIGATLGVLTQLVFAALQMAGELIEFGAGLHPDQVRAPQFEARATLLGTLKLQAALALFACLGGPDLLLRELAETYRVVPLLSFPAWDGTAPAIAEEAAAILFGAVRTGLLLSAPVVAALFLADVALGMVQRIASQVRLDEETPAFKALLAAALLGPVASYWVAAAWAYFQSTIRDAHGVLQRLAQ